MTQQGGESPSRYHRKFGSVVIGCKQPQMDTTNTNTNSLSTATRMRSRSRTTTTAASVSHPPSIVVGYAFGPKKMNTMGVVMAEASKAKVVVSNVDHLVGGSIVNTANPTLLHRYEETVHANQTTNELSNIQHQYKYSYQGKAINEEQKSFIFTMMDHLKNHTNSSITSSVPISSSSVGSAGTSVTSTSTVTVQTKTTNLPRTGNMMDQNTEGQDNIYELPIRVAFVPLDLDTPLEEQHNGKLDIILHKLTEDILYLSQMDPTSPEYHTSPSALRVQRLNHFEQLHPYCVIDPPVKVQALMSRARMVEILQSALQNVTTTSGIPVSTPNYAILHNNTTNWNNNISVISQLHFPLIIKPLVAAGTKASHAMAVVLHPLALPKVLQDKIPCLCQEYANHNGILYKVYVLGRTVSVYPRQSLPNLPSYHNFTNTTTTTTASSPPPLSHYHRVVEFDSQHAFPQREDFGLPDNNDISIITNNVDAGDTLLNGINVDSPSIREVQPIVDALQRSFGLELFGFDILVVDEYQQQCPLIPSSSSSMVRYQPKKMMVVDVNYFPSYKEVDNFPARLATYLAHRATMNHPSFVET